MGGGGEGKEAIVFFFPLRANIERSNRHDHLNTFTFPAEPSGFIAFVLSVLKGAGDDLDRELAQTSIARLKRGVFQFFLQENFFSGILLHF